MNETAAHELYLHLRQQFRDEDLDVMHDGTLRGYSVIVRPPGKYYFIEITNDAGIIISAFYQYNNDPKPYFRSVFATYEEMMKQWW